MEREVREIPDRHTWLGWRMADLTASRIPALFGEHKFLTVEGIEAEMRGASAHGDNPAMRAGRILEPAVAAAISEEKPDWQLTKATTYHRLPEHRLGCTPDYFWGDDGLIQVKTVSPQEWDRWQCHAPLGYTLQTLTELLVTGRTRGVLAVMVRSPSYPLHLFDVPRHGAAERRILGAVANFWRDYDSGKRPLAEPADELAEWLDDGSHRDLSANNHLPELLEERERLKAEASGAEARLKEIDYQLKNCIGEARTAWLPGWLISLPTIHKKAYSVAATDYRQLTVSRTDD